jgi:NAD(P)-dependent dehydrogenase (short-subunit alcohol dehydrogenase family)
LQISALSEIFKLTSAFSTTPNSAIGDRILSNPFVLDGQTVLVTGASSGLGHHFSLTLAKAGAKVAVCARRTERLASLVEEIEAFDGRAMAFAMDVTEPASITAAVEAAETELGPIAVLVNNAGISVQKPAIDMTPDDYDHVMNTNQKGAFFVATEVGRRMIAHGHGGSIINIDSVASFRPLSHLSTYCMSKAAVKHMTKALAVEWARYNVRVNSIAPGYIETEMNSEYFASDQGQAFVKRFLKRRVGVPENLDGALMLLATPAGEFMTGEQIVVDDGLSQAM